MLALSIQQPWAALIMAGEKSIEIRDWHPATVSKMPELPLIIAIHAGQKLDVCGMEHLQLNYAHKLQRISLNDLHFGRLLGHVYLSYVINYTQNENENEFNGDEHLHLNRLIHPDAFNLMRRQGRQLLGLRMSVSSTVLGPKFSGHLGWFNVPDWR